MTKPTKIRRSPPDPAIDRAAIEERLEGRDEIFKRVMDESPIGIALLGTDGSWVRVNDSICNILGYDRDELLEKNFQNVTYPDDLEEDLDCVEELLAGKINSYQIEKRYITKSGQVVWALLSVTLLRGTDNEASLFLSQIVDLTPIKEVESLKGNLITLISHELRTPLTSLILSLDALSKYNNAIKDASYASYITLAQRNCQRLVGLSNDIIDTEIFQSKSFTYHPEYINVRVVIEKAVAENQAISQYYDIPFFVRENSRDCTIYVDAKRLVQVLTNFLSNAAKFANGSKPVTIFTQVTDETVTIVVEDFGIGIPREYHQRLFQKFVRLDNAANRKKDGSGLGLYISKEIVEAMGGTIGFKSTPNVGSQFWCTFPIATPNS